MSKLDLLCHEFENITGQVLDLSSGVTRLEIGEHGPWWIESNFNGQYLKIYHTLGQSKEEDINFWLITNNNIDLLGGSWVALHQPTQTIRLYFIQDITHLDGNTLTNILSNLQQVRENLTLLFITKESTHLKNIINYY